jgi:signal transduction histidine kinase
VHADDHENDIVVSVTDAGPPIDDERFGRMFQPFFTTKSEGLGMGLSICKSIIENHRGRIWAERNPGSDGLTIHIAIPSARG